MKRIYFFFFLLSFSGYAQIKTVLFIGNSYTSVNNLPLLISQIASSLGDSLIYDSSTPGGYTLQLHSTYSPTLTKIASKNWDYVIIQAQSQEPAFPPMQVETDTYPFADSLIKKIKENDSCTRVMFYMTWGRKYGDVVNCPSYPVICTFEGMQYRLRQSYLEMAQMYGDEVAPVGCVWRELRHIDSTLNLYQADDSHPNILGSYTAACTFYCSIFHKQLAGAFVPSGVTVSQANLIQSTTQNIVFDSLNTWMIDTLNNFSNFNYDFDSTGFLHLVATTNGNDLYQWNIGGINYYGQELFITLPLIDNSIELICERNCKLDSSQNTITFLANSISLMNALKVYPNPVNNLLTVNNGEFDKAKIYTVNGKLVQEIQKKGKQIDFSNYEKGIYFLVLEQNSVYAKYVIVKQ